LGILELAEISRQSTPDKALKGQTLLNKGVMTRSFFGGSETRCFYCGNDEATRK
jgi:hypothetical protein